jgi:twitching motility protein PilT
MPQLTSIDDLLEQMVAHGASDLHVTVGSPPAFRVRGHIVRAEQFDALTADDTRSLLYRVLTSEQQKNFELKRQLDFAYSMPGLARFRVNVYYQREAVSAAFRLIPQDIKTLEELRLPPILHSMATYPRGLVLVTGPTGSGKSTTLAAIIDEINRTRAEHILTVEDPI